MFRKFIERPILSSSFPSLLSFWGCLPAHLPIEQYPDIARQHPGFSILYRANAETVIKERCNSAGRTNQRG
jgi:hypothetical protein